MRRLTLLLLLMISTNVLSDWTVREYENLGKTDKDRLGMYIQGLGAGTGMMIIFEGFRNKDYKKLYCQPLMLSLSTDDFINILEKRINMIKRLNYDLDSATIEIVLIEGLIDRFPCDKK